MLFFAIVEACNLRYGFSNLAISVGGEGGASVFLTQVLLLIQTSILFLLFPSLFVGGFAAFGGQGVERLWCRRRRRFLMGLLRESQVEEAYDLATVEWASWLLCRQRLSISHKIDDVCWLVFASASIVFSTNSFQLFCSRLRCFIWAFIDNLRPSLENQIRSNSFGAPSLSNSWRINWRYLR